jgi:SAM-dependent methyltransferase
MSGQHSGALFDDYAKTYDRALRQGLWISGESKEYFARERLRHLRTRLDETASSIRSIIDFGCGVGTSTRFFVELFRPERIVGLDVSSEQLALARRECADLPVSFHLVGDFAPDESVDLVFCNGVFHHIPPAERMDVLDFIYKAIRPGGIFAFWENNPWNPGTRYIMSRVPFDRDAQTLTPREARRLLRAVGCRVLETDYAFFFPRLLSRLRPLERHMSKIPFGAQYLVLAAKGEAPGR